VLQSGYAREFFERRNLFLVSRESGTAFRKAA
jgi:hypothetical protein